MNWITKQNIEAWKLNIDQNISFDFSSLKAQELKEREYSVLPSYASYASLHNPSSRETESQRRYDDANINIDKLNRRLSSKVDFIATKDSKRIKVPWNPRVSLGFNTNKSSKTNLDDPPSSKISSGRRNSRSKQILRK